MMRIPRNHSSFRRELGAAAGIEYNEIATLSTGAEQARITRIDYRPGAVLSKEVSDARDFLSYHRPE